MKARPEEGRVMPDLYQEKKLTVAYRGGVKEREAADFYADLWKLPLIEITDREPIPAGALILEFSEEGVSLLAEGMRNRGDFERMMDRVRPGRWEHELLAKAARFKRKEPDRIGGGLPEALRALDATAGMGEDALILAAAGFEVDLAERDPVIHLLLEDAIARAGGNANIYLRELAARMRPVEGDSIRRMREAMPGDWDLIYLDPMFPERRKSGLVKKKFQLIHRLERPATDEEELLAAALAARPRKIVIKRPRKGPDLAGEKPSYRILGKAIRYDVIVLT